MAGLVERRSHAEKGVCISLKWRARALYVVCLFVCLFDSFILAGFPHLVEQRSHAEEGSYDDDMLDASVEGGSFLSRAALSIDPISAIDVAVS